MAEKTLKKENYNLDDVALVLVDICIQDDVAYRIVDQREITLCKDCKYWEKSDNAVWCRRTAIGIFRMEEEDFCSKGERR